MKHILDYIEEECAGCATPGNTMGMGNPMPPSEEAPGSEPLCGKCKKEKKKKKVTESILDDDLGDGLNEKIILEWFARHYASNITKIKVGKDLKVSSEYLSIYLDDNDPEIPNWIQFGDVKTFKLEVCFDRPVKEYKLSNIPTNCERFNLECYKMDRLIIDVPSLTVKQEIYVSSSGNSGITELVLPDKVHCSHMNLSQCSILESLKYKKIDTISANLPPSYVGRVVKKELGFGKHIDVSMNGNTLGNN